MVKREGIRAPSGFHQHMLHYRNHHDECNEKEDPPPDPIQSHRPKVATRDVTPRHSPVEVVQEQLGVPWLTQQPHLLVRHDGIAIGYQPALSVSWLVELNCLQVLIQSRQHIRI